MSTPSSLPNPNPNSNPAPAPDWLARRAALKEQEWDLSQKCFTAAGLFFDRLLAADPPKGLAADALRLLVAASKYARLATAPDPVATPVTPPGGIPPLAPEIVAALDKVYGPRSDPKPKSARPPVPDSALAAPSVELSPPPAAATPPDDPAPPAEAPPTRPARPPRLNHNLTPQEPAPRSAHKSPASPAGSKQKPSPTPAPEPERPDVTPVPLRLSPPLINDPFAAKPYRNPKMPSLDNVFYLWATIDDL